MIQFNVLNLLPVFGGFYRGFYWFLPRDALVSEQKPIKNLGENGAWAYTGTAQIF